MTKNEILLGFEVDTGKPVSIAPNHLVVCGVTQESGKCLSGDDLIVSTTGELITVLDAYKNQKPIKTISLNDNYKITEDNLISVFENGVKEIFQIQTEDGRKIKLTENHPVLTVDGWKKIGELSVGDRIAVPRTLELIDSGKTIPDSALKIMGYMLSEGSMTISKSSPGFTSANPTLAIDLFWALFDHGLELKKIGEIEYRIRQSVKYAIPFKKEKRIGNAGCPSYGYWKNFCKIYDLKQTKSNEKEIPEVVFKCSKEKIALFLSRLFAGDGCFTIGKQMVSYASTSKKLLIQVQHLLLRFGIKSRFSEKPELCIVQSDTRKFLETIGFFGREIRFKESKHFGTFDTVPIKIPLLKKYKEHWVFAGHRYGYPSRPILERYALHNQNEFLLKMAQSDIYWVKIKAKEKCPAEMTYDVTTQKTGNLVVNDFFVHNTTTLEALISRSELKAIAFKTKIGEKGFSFGNLTPPFFKDRFDWEYAKEILQAETKGTMKFETSWIIDASKGANSLLEFKANIDNALATGTIQSRKLNELSRSVYTTLQAYLDKVLPQLQYMGLSKTLDLRDGLNIIDLEKFRESPQSLLIRSVLIEVLENHPNTIVVIPEAWRFAPQKYGNPCKRPMEVFIRQGASNRNLLWIDSQDITGIEKTILKQVSTWILGYQSEINEIKRTLDQIPVPPKNKPKPEEIASLELGQFFCVTKTFTKKVYVCPAWMEIETAKKVALGKIPLDKIERPKNLATFSITPHTPIETIHNQTHDSASRTEIQDLRRELVETREDFFNKIRDLQESIPQIIENVKHDLQPTPINTDEIVSKVLQKIPINSPVNKNSSIDEETLIQKILAKIPASGGATYTVSPLEKIKKTFLEEAKNKILEEVSTLNGEEKKIFQFVEVLGRNSNVSEIMEKLLHINSTGGSRGRIQEELNNLSSIGFLRKDQAHQRFYPNLKEKINSKIEIHGATEQEKDLLYNHILNSMLTIGKD